MNCESLKVKLMAEFFEGLRHVDQIKFAKLCKIKNQWKRRKFKIMLKL